MDKETTEWIEIEGLELPNGVYDIKTNEGNEIKAEMFFGNWHTYGNFSEEGEYVTHVKI
jgi:hypothetical protein